MVNHFRTLLLNLSYAGDRTEYIPSDFINLSLPIELQNFYNLILPPTASRYFKKFLSYNYLQYIDASNLSQDLLTFDPRISYNLTDFSNYFQVNRVSSPTLILPTSPSNTDTGISIVVKGFYTSIPNLASLSETIVVQQPLNGANSNTITIYAEDANGVNINTYFNGTITFSNTNYGTSSEMVLSNGLTVYIKTPTGSTTNFFDLTGYASGREWKFETQSQNNFDFSLIYDSVVNSPSIVDAMFQYPSEDISKYYSLWTTHFNKLYRFSGLLIAYGYKVNRLLP